MPEETIGDTVTVSTADHPARSDSPEYIRSRATLMGQYSGGCVICGGQSDLTHPGETADPRALGLEDHHGGGIWVRLADGATVMVAQNLFPIEWSEGWGADPALVAQFVAAQNELLRRLGQPTYDAPITDTNGVMGYVDSVYNANIKLCHPHHLGHQTQSSKDASGHEAVGIHNIPGPIFWYQRFNDWERWDMWGGTTGTIAVAPKVDAAGNITAASVLHLSAYHHDAQLVDLWHKGYRQMTLGPDHPVTRAARR